jgi:fructosamine-3-kinase
MTPNTTQPQDFSPQTLTQLVSPFLGAGPDNLHFSPVKTGKHNHSYWVESQSGRYVLRIAPPDDAGLLFYERLMMRQEPSLHRLILEGTDLPVATIIGHDFSRERIDRDYLLMGALPGDPLSELQNLTQAQLDRVLYQVGQHLRQLHTLTAGDCLGLQAYGYLGEHRPMPLQPDWASAFQVMWNRLLDDVVACGGYTPQDAHFMRRLFEEQAHHFERPVPASLLHMDIWGENILIDRQGNVTGIVDFDRALWGDVEIEFAVLDYCGISEPPFWQGYGLPRDTSHPAEIRRLFYLLYEVQKYIPIFVWRGKNLAEAARYRDHSRAIANQLVKAL